MLSLAHTPLSQSHLQEQLDSSDESTSQNASDDYTVLHVTVLSTGLSRSTHQLAHQSALHPRAKAAKGLTCLSLDLSSISSRKHKHLCSFIHSQELQQHLSSSSSSTAQTAARKLCDKTTEKRDEVINGS